MSLYGVAGIYKITCTGNDKIYIGSSINIGKRFSSHRRDLERGRHGNQYLMNSYKKYGRDSLVYEMVEEVKDPSREKLLEREKFWFDKTGCCETGLNICSTPQGGSGKTGEDHPMFGLKGEDHPAFGYKHTEESLERMSEASKASWSRPDFREERGKQLARLATTEEGKKHIQRISTASGLKRRALNDEQIAELRSLYATGNFTYRELAERFSVTYDIIQANVGGRKKTGPVDWIAQEVKNEIRQKISEGISIIKIRNEYHLSATTVSRIRDESNESV